MKITGIGDLRPWGVPQTLQGISPLTCYRALSTPILARRQERGAVDSRSVCAVLLFCVFSMAYYPRKMRDCHFMMGKLEQPNPDSDIGYRTDNLTRLDSVQDVRRGICIRVFRNVCPS